MRQGVSRGSQACPACQASGPRGAPDPVLTLRPCPHPRGPRDPAPHSQHPPDRGAPRDSLRQAVPRRLPHAAPSCAAGLGPRVGPPRGGAGRPGAPPPAGEAGPRPPLGESLVPRRGPSGNSSTSEAEPGAFRARRTWGRFQHARGLETDFEEPET